jgi:hypothetical protein
MGKWAKTKMSIFFKDDIIEFHCKPEFFGVIPEPIPAYKDIPDWFKRLPQHIEDPSVPRDTWGRKMTTAKKCLPLLDAMSLGYIIPLSGTINLRVSKDGKLLDIPEIPIPAIQTHHIAQVGNNYPGSPTMPLKFINRWFIKTAPGYSVLIIPPINHFDPRFTCLSGVVDTDVFDQTINFPAMWHIKDFDGTLEAGTPLVTVIPFKRKNIPRSVKVRVSTVNEINKNKKLEAKQCARHSVYNSELREPRK